MENVYPKLKGITKIEILKGRCSLCNKLRPDRKVIIEFTKFRCEDASYKVHSECLANIGKVFLVDAITKPNVKA